MPSRLPTAGMLGAWANVRYGGYSSGGPDALSRFLEMTPAELRQLDCVEYREAADVIVAGRSQFSQAQRDALIARANECAVNNPLLPDLIDPGVKGNIVDDPAGGLRDAASSVLEGAGVVLGNIVISAAGVALIVMGISRMFGVNPVRAAARATPAGRLAGA